MYVCGVFGFPTGYSLQQTVSEYSSDAPALHKVHKGFGFFGCFKHWLQPSSCRVPVALRVLPMYLAFHPILNAAPVKIATAPCSASNKQHMTMPPMKGMLMGGCMAILTFVKQTEG